MKDGVLLLQCLSLTLSLALSIVRALSLPRSLPLWERLTTLKMFLPLFSENVESWLGGGCASRFSKEPQDIYITHTRTCTDVHTLAAGLQLCTAQFCLCVGLQHGNWHWKVVFSLGFLFKKNYKKKKLGTQVEQLQQAGVSPTDKSLSFLLQNCLTLPTSASA